MKKTEDIATLEELAKMKRKISPDREITLSVNLANVDSRLDLFSLLKNTRDGLIFIKVMLTIILVVRFFISQKAKQKIYREELWLCRHNKN